MKYFKLIALVFIVAGIAGCHKPAPDAAQVAVSSASSIVSADLETEPVPASLKGGWIVSAIDGRPPVYAIPLIGLSDYLYWPPGCAGQSIRWRATADGLDFRFDEESRSDPDDGPRTVCDIGYPEQLPGVLARLAGATLTTANRDGGFHFEGETGSVSIRPARLTEEGLEIPATLSGQYLASSIDGRKVPGQQKIIVTIDNDTIGFNPRCAGFVWTYKSTGERLKTSRASNPDDLAPGEAPPPVCAIAVSPAQLALAMALDGATRVDLVGTNTVRLSGDSHSVTLAIQ